MSEKEDISTPQGPSGFDHSSSAAQHFFLLTMHHLISDGMSGDIIVKDLNELYMRKSLTPLPITYGDYSAHQRQCFEIDKTMTEQMEYWKEQLRDSPTLIDLPLDHPRPLIQEHKAQIACTIIGPELLGTVSQMAREHGVTQFVLLLAVLQALLHRYGGANDLVVGSPVTTRKNPKTLPLVGMFVNTVAYRAKFFEGITFVEHLSNAKQVVQEAKRNEDLPFEKVVAQRKPERSTSHEPIFQVFFAMLPRTSGESLSLFGATAETDIWPSNANMFTKFDLEFSIQEDKESKLLRVMCAYATSLFKKSTIEQMLDHYQVLLKAILRTPHAKIDALNMNSPKEEQYLTNTLNDTAAALHFDIPVPFLMLKQAANTPHAIAFVHGEDHVSYAELGRRSIFVANMLKTQFGAARNLVVGLHVKFSPNLLPALYGILLSGAAYMPLNIESQMDAVMGIIHDAQPCAVIVDRSSAEAFDEMFSNKSAESTLPPLMVIEDTLDNAMKSPPCELDQFEIPKMNPSDLFNILYTSGTTSKPKGVRVSHRGIANIVSDLGRVPSLTNQDRTLLRSPFTFDVHAMEIWAPLATGGTVCIIDPHENMDYPALVHRMWRERISFLQIVPSLFEKVMEYINIKNMQVALKSIILCGEAVTNVCVSEFLKLFAGRAHLYNMYGPAEATVYSTSTELTMTEDMIPIGSAASNTSIYILDAHKNLQPRGVIGELYIAGAGVALGYLNRPELSAQRFVPDPWRPGQMMYQTGDLARYRHDGSLIFYGREDSQIKLHGIRIELSEIESYLCQHPKIHQAAVVLRLDHKGDKCLIGYAVLDPQATAEPTSEEIMEFLSSKIAPQKIPRVVEIIQEMPLNANKKMDRNALKKRPLPLSVMIPPTQPTPLHINHSGAADIVRMWSEMLDIPRETINPMSNFLDQGGNSMLLANLVWKINDSGLCEEEIKVMDFFQNPTFSHILDKMRMIEPSGMDKEPYCKLDRINNRLQCFMIPGVSTVRDFHTAGRSKFCDFQMIGVSYEDLMKECRTIEELAHVLAQKVRLDQAYEPYVLCGHSFGAIVAAEIAEVLISKGLNVPMVINLDGELRSFLAEDEYLLQHHDPEFHRAYFLAHHIPGNRWAHTLFLYLCVDVQAPRTEEIQLNCAIDLTVSVMAKQDLLWDRSYARRRVEHAALCTQLRWKYKPRKRYDCHMAFVLAQEGDSEGILDGWRTHMDPENIILQKSVPGNHFTMLKEPQVDWTVKMVNYLVTEAYGILERRRSSNWSNRGIEPHIPAAHLPTAPPPEVNNNATPRKSTFWERLYEKVANSGVIPM